MGLGQPPPFLSLGAAGQTADDMEAVLGPPGTVANHRVV